MVRYRSNKRGEPSWKRGHSRIFTTISRFARRERFKRFCLLETVLRSVLFRFENSVSARTKRVSSWALCIRWKFLLGIRVTSKEHFGYFWRTSGLVGLMTAISYDSVTEFWSDAKWYIPSTHLFSSLFSIVSFLFLYLDMS